jgi:hypothetical protein
LSSLAARLGSLLVQKRPNPLLGPVSVGRHVGDHRRARFELPMSLAEGG